MEFRLYIESNKNHAVEIEAEQIGLAALERVRTELHLPGMDARLLKPVTHSLQEDLSIAISESIARDSGHYMHQPSVVVKTPAAYLNRYAETKVHATRETTTDEITSAGLQRRTNETDVITAWIAAGYPLQWGFPEEPETEAETETED